jgi:hypothetical protein
MSTSSIIQNTWQTTTPSSVIPQNNTPGQTAASPAVVEAASTNMNHTAVSSIVSLPNTSNVTVSFLPMKENPKRKLLKEIKKAKTCAYKSSKFRDTRHLKRLETKQQKPVKIPPDPPSPTTERLLKELSSAEYSMLEDVCEGQRMMEEMNLPTGMTVDDSRRVAKRTKNESAETDKSAVTDKVYLQEIRSTKKNELT